MLQVGDGATHAAFLEALTASHTRIGRVDAWYEGEKIAELDFGDADNPDTALSDGSVSVTGRNRERRRLQLSATEKLWPLNPGDTLSPYGVWLQAFVTVQAGSTVFPAVPVMAGKIETVARDRWSGAINAVVVDPMAQVNREAIEAPRQAPITTIGRAILTLLNEVFPSATLEDQTGSTELVPADTIWSAGSGSRGRAIDELCACIGAELFARPTTVPPYGDFVLRPVPSLGDEVVWTPPDGARSLVERDQLALSGARVVNRWIVSVDRPDSGTLFVPVTDDDASSPTRYGGPMGKLVDFYSSPLVTTVGQAQTAGMAKLNRSKGLASTRRLLIMANPALEAGDVLVLTVDGEGPEYHIVDDIDLPMTPEPASMIVTTRSAQGGDAD